jgi:acyl-CoA thioester hydrolase
MKLPGFCPWREPYHGTAMPRHRSTVMHIEPQWIDYNGHFNMAYYGVLFDRAADQLFAELGLGPDYVKATNNSFFTLETHCTYLKEMRAEHPVVIESQILDHDHKRVHYVQLMQHADEGWVSCVLEVMVSHVDLKAHKTSPFPEDVSTRIEAMAAAHHFLPNVPQVGHKIGLPRSIVSKEVLQKAFDENGIERDRETEK